MEIQQHEQSAADLSTDQASRERWLEQRQFRDKGKARINEHWRIQSETDLLEPHTVTNVLTRLSTKFFSDYSGDAVVVGEVQNTTASTLSFSTTHFYFYDSLGTSVGSDYSYVHGSQNARLALTGSFISVLPPGAIGFFKVWTSIPSARISTYTFGSEAETYATTSPRTTLSLASGISLVPNVLGGTDYGLSMSNGGTGVVAYFAQIYLAGYSGGVINDVDFSYANGTSITLCGVTTDTAIQPGATAPVSSYFLRPVSSVPRIAFEWDEVAVTPTTLTVPAAGGTGTFSVLSNCGWTAASNVSWITVTSGASGSRDGTVTLSVSPNSGTARSGTLTVAGFTVTVTQSPASTCSYAISPISQSFIAGGGAGSVSVTTASGCAWTSGSNANWITITGGSSVSGSGTVAYRVAANTTAARTGTLTIAGLTFTVTQVGSVFTGGPPFGSFDTPTQGQAGVAGSIAVTGWALDDSSVDRVEIWRDLVAGETTAPFSSPGHPGHGKVFIANPLFVNGARPDVAAAYPNYPNANRAGWGYLLLTWGLWNQGNGTFTLYAFAFDSTSNYVTLGTRTITVSNATATKPFGALDTPIYGQTVTTSSWNYGWALTPKANGADLRTCTITNGNVFVGIDSGPLIPVMYGGNRTDIAGFFPGFSNGAAAGGAYYINSTTLTNGTHQIGWYVVDNCGRADGIGSRFFSVAKSSLTTAVDTQADSRRADVGVIAPHVSVRTTGGEWTAATPTATGVHILEVAQHERLEVQLPTIAGALYTGAQVVSGESRGLPLGSSLDTANGIFYWQPAAGFLGSFDLVFTSGGAETKVRMVVGPSMRMAVDAPSVGGIVQQSFTVAGWAVDLAATNGAGIDTVHVWAYPVAGGDPTFLGVANVGGYRPDVAVTYGAEFERSSYNLVAPSLAPGSYDVIVYVHRAATGSFDGAQTVRVTVR